MFILNLLLAVVVADVIGRLIGNRIRYLKGKAEVSHIPCGEPIELRMEEFS